MSIDIDEGDDVFVEIPAFRRKRVLKQVDEIQVILQRLAFEGDARKPISRSAAAAIGRRLGIDGLDARDAIINSADDLEACGHYHRGVVRRFAWRIACNVDSLAMGWSVPYQPASVQPHQARAKITGVSVDRGAKHKSQACQVAFRIETGLLAGHQTVRPCSEARLKSIYMVATGYPRKCGFTSPRLLIGLSLAAKVSLDDEVISVEEIRVAKSQRSANVKLTRSRFRNISPCPVGLAVDCVLCRVGKNECDRSTLATDTNLLRKPNDDATGIQEDADG